MARGSIGTSMNGHLVKVSTVRTTKKHGEKLPCNCRACRNNILKQRKPFCKVWKVFYPNQVTCRCYNYDKYLDINN